MADKILDTNSSPPEDELLQSDHWIQEYGDYLYRYAFMHLKNQSVAEDVVQDTLLSAYRARHQFQGNSSVKTWLTIILRHKIIDQVRKNKRDILYDPISFDEDPVIKSSFNSYGFRTKWINSWASTPEVLTVQKDFLEQLGSCLMALPSNLRQVFMLRNVDNLSTEEISDMLGISPNNVWVILYRSRIRLRECLEMKWFNN